MAVVLTDHLTAVGSDDVFPECASVLSCGSVVSIEMSRIRQHCLRDNIERVALFISPDRRHKGVSSHANRHPTVGLLLPLPLIFLTIVFSPFLVPTDKLHEFLHLNLTGFDCV